MCNRIPRRKGNKIELRDDHAVIHAHWKGTTVEVLCDLEDVEMLSGYTWGISEPGKVRKTKVAQTMVPKGAGKRKCIHMHRLLLGFPKGYSVDHWDRNTLNNRRLNLRVCTQGQNYGNRVAPDVRRSSRYKGVYWCKPRRCWVATIHPKGRSIYLGGFDDEIDAARAYDQAAQEHFGEFARLNLS